MKTESLVRIFAGSMVLVSLALAHFVHPAWLWLTAFVGFNLFQSGFTRFCLAERIFLKLGWAKPEAGCAVAAERPRG